MTTADGVQARKTNWPVKLYVAALLFAWISLLIFTPALDGPQINAGRSMAQSAVCAVLGLRFLWAIYRRKQSRTWILYLILMLLAVPIWLIVEPIVFSLGR